MEKTEKDLGTSGKQGYTIHIDYRGWKISQEINNDDPNWLKEIKKLRNQSMKSQWLETIAGNHNFSGFDSDEVNKKSKKMSDWVNNQLDLIEKEYVIVDKAINLLEMKFKNKNI